MPIYAYKCKACGERFEAMRRMSDRDEDVCCRRAPELGGAGTMPLCSAAGWCGEWVEREVGE